MIISNSTVADHCTWWKKLPG